MNMKEILLSLITEAANWEDQLDTFEKNEITHSEARLRVINRIYKKYCAQFALTDTKMECNSCDFSIKKLQA